MASGHVNRILKAEHMAAPTNPANVKKALANSEPSTHGMKPRWQFRFDALRLLFGSWCLLMFASLPESR